MEAIRSALEAAGVEFTNGAIFESDGGREAEEGEDCD
jgi:hypothetical protein